MKIKPHSNRIVIKEIKPGEKIGSIIIPSIAEERLFKKGRVIAVGPGRHINGVLEPIGVAVEDIVLFDPVGTVACRETGEELLLMRADSVLCTLEE